MTELYVFLGGLRQPVRGDDYEGGKQTRGHVLVYIQCVCLPVLARTVGRISIILLLGEGR